MKCKTCFIYVGFNSKRKKWGKKCLEISAIKGGVGPLMANAILNFHFDYVTTSLRKRLWPDKLQSSSSCCVWGSWWAPPSCSCLSSVSPSPCAKYHGWPTITFLTTIIATKPYPLLLCPTTTITICKTPCWVVHLCLAQTLVGLVSKAQHLPHCHSKAPSIRLVAELLCLSNVNKIMSQRAKQFKRSTPRQKKPFSRSPRAHSTEPPWLVLLCQAPSRPAIWYFQSLPAMQCLVPDFQRK